MMTVNQTTAPITAGQPAGAAELRAELERLRAENRTLVRLNRLQGRFVAMASHEFKTPLTSITAYTEALLAQGGDSGFARSEEFLGVIRDEAARLLRMINRILDFSRLEYGSRLLQRDPADLGELARETLRGFGASLAARNQSGAVDAAADLPAATVDADLMRQVLVNLVGNAAKFSPDGGHVRLQVREEAATMALEVADDGPGIPLEDMQRVFSEFYRSAGTSEVTGTGLGLSIVRHVVHLHGGYVTVRNRAAAGAAFTVHLPKLVHVNPCEELGDNPDCAAVLRNIVRLLADFTGARAAVLMLRDPAGRARTAAHMGLPADRMLPAHIDLPEGDSGDPSVWLTVLDPGADAPRGDWLVVPLDADSEVKGWVLLGRRMEDRAFGPRDRDQAAALGRLGGRALTAFTRDPAHTLEALRVLVRIRWRGVPTAAAEALDLASSLGRGVGLSPAGVARLQDAVALHDAGMDRIEDDILLGQGDLSPDDRGEIDRHVALGLDLLAPLLTDGATTRIIRHHHERWDGCGHPDGLKGAEIPVEARTLAVIDAWFSLTRGRPNRPGKSPGCALAEIRGSSGSQFDPGIVDNLARLVAAQPCAGSAPAKA